MARIRIVDDSIWAKHIEDGAALKKRIVSLKAGDELDLEVDGVVGRWERMRDGRDGRPTLGIKPLAAMREIWSLWRKQPARIVEVREVVAADSYLASVGQLMSEWDTPEDDEAYRDL